MKNIEDEIDNQVQERVYDQVKKPHLYIVRDQVSLQIFEDVAAGIANITDITDQVGAQILNQIRNPRT